MGIPHQGHNACLARVQEAQLTPARAATTQGGKDINFLISLYINVCRNIDMYSTATKNKGKDGRRDSLGS
jgi:hypothetical protein